MSNTYGVAVCEYYGACYNYTTPDGVDANHNGLSLLEPRSGSTIVTAPTSQCSLNRVAVGQL